MAEKFRRIVKREVLAHDRMQELGHWYKCEVRRKSVLEEDDPSRRGMKHNIHAALVFRAFEVEAILNSYGHYALEEGWPERASFWEKVALLSKVLEFPFAKGEEPWQSVGELKKLRDTLAHGKPEFSEHQDVIEEDDEEAFWAFFNPSWETRTSPDFLEKVGGAVDKLGDILDGAAKVKGLRVLTHVHEEQRPLSF